MYQRKAEKLVLIKLKEGIQQLHVLHDSGLVPGPRKTKSLENTLFGQ